MTGTVDQEIDPKPNYFRQFLYVMILSMSLLSYGCTVTWPAVLPGILQDNVGVTDEDVKWLVSAPSLATVIVPLTTGLVDRLGTRRVLTFCILPFAASWVAMGLSTSREILYVTRILQGFVGALFLTFAPALLGELVSPNIRGLLTFITQLQMAVGIFVMFVLAKFFSWQTATWICALPLLPTFLLMFTVPESPYWLTKKGEHERAKKSLEVLRGTENVGEELDLIKAHQAGQPCTSVKEQLSLLSMPSNYKPIILVSLTWLLLNLGGQFAVFEYAVFIFQESEVGLDPFTSSIILGLVRIFSTFLSLFLVDRVGSRLLFLVTLIGSFLSFEFITLSLFLPEIPSWVPLVFILLFSIFFGLGIGPIPTLLTVELVPLPVRSLGSTLCILTLDLSKYVSLLIFPMLMNSVGIAVTFALMGTMFAVTAIVVWMWIPECTGKTLIDIQGSFNGQKGRNGCENRAFQMGNEENQEPERDPEKDASLKKV